MTYSPTDSSSSASSRTGAFKDDASVLADDVKTTAHDAASAAKSGARELGEGASHALDAAKRKLQDATEVAKDAAAKAAGTLKTTVAENPLVSLSVALGAGLVIGLLLLRSRR